MLPTLLDGLDIAGAVITADALHTQRATARYLHDRGAEFVFCVKENQPKLLFLLERYITDLTGTATSAVATLGITSQTGRTDITEATRWANRRPNRPFTILGLTA